jgi:L-aminopeptidase/D-esterase-like protein
LKDQGSRTGNWDDVAFVPGAVLYDFVSHRLTEIYPDKRLAQAALQALRPGAFPLGAQGAGRMAMQGSFFGCGAHSGQGAAFRQEGELKLAAFVVVNATGAVVKRDGNLLRCAPSADGSAVPGIADLLARFGRNPRPESAPAVPTRATTLSLVVTNRQMGAAALQRLAVQVHGSMGRAIQPFSTQEDGDTLFAVSTQELAPAASALSLMQIDVIASELMWDAILASAPEEPAAAMPQTVAVAPERLARLAGRYRFGPQALIEVAVAEGRLVARMGAPGFFDLRPGQPVTLMPRSETEFGIEGRHGMQLVFTLGADGRAVTALLNPGRWQQRGERLPD